VLRLAPGPVVHLVGGAAGPLGGDDLVLDVTVGDGATLVVRGVAAMLAQPGVDPDERGRLSIRATVGEGATLDWDPEPTILVEGCRLDLGVSLDAASDACIRWSEELVLGRSGEGSGEVVSRTRVVVGGRLALDHRMEVGGPVGPWDGPGGLAGHRWVGTVLHLGRPGPATSSIDPVATAELRAADLTLATGGTLRAATALDRRHGRPALTCGATTRLATR
jgi:urease accessory protein